MPVVRPLQPMTGSAAQEDLGAMTNHITAWLPETPPHLVKRRINARLRAVYDRRLWAGLLVRGQLIAPATYNTGTVAVTLGSNIVTGTATNWSATNKVHTTLSTAITIANEVQDITPASMAGIELGDFLMIGTPSVDEEALLVTSVGTTTFQAKPRYTHAMDASLTESTLVRRQFRLGNSTSFYTVKGIRFPTTGDTAEMLLDLPWGHDSATGSSYEITKIYYPMEPGLRMVFSVLSHAQGWKLSLHWPREVIDTWDAWRSGQGWSYMLADYMPDELSRAQYELYPAPSSAQCFPYLAYGTPPDLVDETDAPPLCIPSHMLVHGALADLFLFNRKSNYYDPVASQKFGIQFEIDLAAAALVDDSVLMQNLMWSFQKYPFVGGGASWAQSHDAD